MPVLSQIPALLAPYLMQMLRLSVWFVLLTVLFLPLERLFAVHPSRILRKAVGQDILYYFLSSLTPTFALALPISVLAWSARHLMPEAYLTWVAQTPLLARVLASFVVGEIGFYWGHRWSHEWPLLWRFHAVHHSAEHMDFLVNTRAHPVDLVFTRLCGLVPLYLFGLAEPARGVSGTLPLLVLLGGTVWGFFVHSNVRWRFGWFEWLIATPGFHHWHHTNDSPELYNKNFASMLPVLDHAFGTLYLPTASHPQSYGIHPQVPEAFVDQLTGPFRADRSTFPPDRVVPEV